MILKVGFAQAIITPSLETAVFLAGFGRNRPAQTVHDDLYTRALAMQFDRQTLIVVALDLIGLHREACQEIERSVAERLPGTQMLVACTHTHHGPDTMGLWGPNEFTSGVDESYMARLTETVARTAVEATVMLQEVDLAATSVQVRGLVKNFRDPAIMDEELTCLQFRESVGERIVATWLVFPCHPEVLWDQNPHITSDYLYALRQHVESATAAPCLVHVGALGGMMSPDVVDHSFEEAAVMGLILAEAAKEALAGLEAQPMTRFEYRRQEFAVPMENPLFEMAVSLGLLPPSKLPDGTVLTEASLLRLNDVLLFAVPGELLPKLGLHFRELLRQAGARVTTIVGLANDELGYILPIEDFAFPEDYLDPGSSYEESMSLGPQIGPKLAETLHKLLSEQSA